MGTDQIRFDDGAAYERYMGEWSRLAGETFLDWLAPKPGLRWLDVGCGNGAFTEMLVGRCAPASVQGVDPSEKKHHGRDHRGGVEVGRDRGGRRHRPWQPEVEWNLGALGERGHDDEEPRGVEEQARLYPLG